MKTHKEMFSSSVLSLVPYVFQETRSGNYANYSMVNDPLVDEATFGTWANYFDLDKRYQIVKDITPYLLDQAWFVVLPGDYAYTFWQPWVKNYHGEQGVGLWDGDWARWAWLDQDLKEEMTGRR